MLARETTPRANAAPPDPAAVSATEPTARPRRIFFSLLHAGYLRHYAQPIRLLAASGHHVHVAVSYPEKDRGDDLLLEALVAQCPTVTTAPAPSRYSVDGWRRIAWLVRAMLDLSRYAHPRYVDAIALKQRIAGKIRLRLDSRHVDPVTRRMLGRLVERLVTETDESLSIRWIRRLSLLEEAIPPSRRIARELARYRPDLVVASPVVEAASSQIELLKAARTRGITTGVCIASWDNLTNKGLIRFLPDRVLVWNAIQQREAEELHGIPPERVVQTGAQRYDPWFERVPSTTPDEFKRRVGLDPDVPFVLYVCSSSFIARNEVEFVRRWLQALRTSGDATARTIAVLVRPHPQNGRQWDGVDLSDLAPAVVWPPLGAQPDDEEARAGYFDSIAHSSAVVGINTSALIEAGIVGKTVHTVLDPAFATTQEGTLHFHYLRAENGGHLHVARDLDEHVARLTRTLEGGEGDEARTRSFIEAFVRPRGLQLPAARVVAAELEALSLLPMSPAPTRPRLVPALTALLYPVAVASTALATATEAVRWLRRRLDALRRNGATPVGGPDVD